MHKLRGLHEPRVAPAQRPLPLIMAEGRIGWHVPLACICVGQVVATGALICLARNTALLLRPPLALQPHPHLRLAEQRHRVLTLVLPRHFLPNRLYRALQRAQLHLPHLVLLPQLQHLGHQRPERLLPLHRVGNRRFAHPEHQFLLQILGVALQVSDILLVFCQLPAQLAVLLLQTQHIPAQTLIICQQLLILAFQLPQIALDIGHLRSVQFLLVILRLDVVTTV